MFSRPLRLKHLDGLKNAVHERVKQVMRDCQYKMVLKL